jgi:hypothetical protein
MAAVDITVVTTIPAMVAEATTDTMETMAAIRAMVDATTILATILVTTTVHIVMVATAKGKLWAIRLIPQSRRDITIR